MKEMFEGYLLVKIAYKQYQNNEIDFYKWLSVIEGYCKEFNIDYNLVYYSL